jgi:hypothetical protein
VVCPPWGALGLLRGDPPRHGGGQLPLGPVVLGLVAPWARRGVCAVLGCCGGCWLPLKGCTAPPTSTRGGVAGSTHGGHQPPPHAWRHPLLGLGFVATLRTVRMTGGCANNTGGWGVLRCLMGAPPTHGVMMVALAAC